MYCYEYPRPMVCVDMVVLRKTDNGHEILLIERGNDPYKGSWALPGGFIEMDEKLEDSAYRELAEETQITQIELRQLKTYGNPLRDPRGRNISVVYGGILISGENPVAGDDANRVNWFDVKQLPPLAFDHDFIIFESINLILGDLGF